ncbi:MULTISPECIES: GAP family protein [Actinomycetes]|uniref:GAP family protein n=1 Tax=Actinomycetes TaxID=1760 RepID=UPI0006689D9F|nr:MULTISPECIES: GAP family protein [Micrococcus]MCV7497806.1 GAP family protein [Micrococcus luteus]MCV7508720.1 GAP family protein [Micrococcus luteus]MCV7615890.1 GAP family protein [Micrococcus luteus]MCV7716170.1 GAP family protein [Micrococcus luteus]MCV7725762.1 GAP family protein [Micrococcus luteus]
MTAEIGTLLSLAPVLTALALVDALSLGALAVPVWLLAAPGRLRARRVLLYLGTLAAFYAAVGAVLLLAASAVSATGLVDTESPVFRVGLFAVGAVLLVLSFVLDPGGDRGRRNASRAAGRLSRWRERALAIPDASGTRGSGSSLVGLALVAGALELVTMVPYLGAVGILSGSPLSTPVQFAVLGAYCLVMVAPALALVVLRMLLRDAITPLLRRLDRWFIAQGASATAWLIGILGVVLMVHNVRFLGEVFSAPQAHFPIPGLV